jgi:hypothetical protein
MRRRAKPQLIQHLDELPTPLVQQVTQAGIDPTCAHVHLDSLLNALHIRTKERYYTREGFERIR